MKWRRFTRRLFHLTYHAFRETWRELAGFAAAIGFLSIVRFIPENGYAFINKFKYILKYILSFLAIFVFFAFLFKIIRYIIRSWSDVLPAKDERRFYAVPYSASSDRDQFELARMARAKFGETFPDEVDLFAVRHGCALGLRLTIDDGTNVGFLDVYHLTEAAMHRWLNGELDERRMAAEHFEPIPPANERADREISFMLGALLVDTSSPYVNHHLARIFIDAGKDYFSEQCYGFTAVHVNATIFSEAGKRWAEAEGFREAIAGDRRGRHGGGHAVYRVTLQPARNLVRNSYRCHNPNLTCQYVLRLRPA